MFAFKVLVIALLSASAFAQWSSGEESPSSRSADVEASGSEVSVTRRDADESSGIYESPEVYRRSVEGSAESDEVSSRSSDLGSGDSSDVARRSAEASGQDESPSSRSADIEASGSEVSITRRDVEASGSDSMVSSRSDDGSGSEESSNVVRRSSEASGEEESVISRRSAEEEEGGSGDAEFRSLACVCVVAEKIEVFEPGKESNDSEESYVHRRSVEGSGSSGANQPPVAYVHKATSRSDDLEPVAAISVHRVVVCKCEDSDDFDGSASGDINMDFFRQTKFEASGSELTISRRDAEASGSESMVSSRSDDGSGSEDSSDMVRRSALDSESSGEEQTSPPPTRARRLVEASGSTGEF